jgi:hypothetical protein
MARRPILAMRTVLRYGYPGRKGWLARFAPPFAMTELEVVFYDVTDLAREEDMAAAFTAAAPRVWADRASDPIGAPPPTTRRKHITVEAQINHRLVSPAA